MHVGVFVLVIISDDVENCPWFLRAGGVVEVDQGVTVHALAQDRKIHAERRPIDLSVGRLVHDTICSMRRFAPVDSRISQDRSGPHGWQKTAQLGPKSENNGGL